MNNLNTTADIIVQLMESLTTEEDFLELRQQVLHRLGALSGPFHPDKCDHGRDTWIGSIVVPDAIPSMIDCYMYIEHSSTHWCGRYGPEDGDFISSLHARRDHPDDPVSIKAALALFRAQKTQRSFCQSHSLLR